TKKECEFIEKNAQLQPSAKLLDLACGHGRHANYFAQKGYPVTGIDFDEDFIRRARATALEAQLTATFKLQNMLDIAYESEFDLIYLLANSLGFLDRDDCKLLFQKMNKALKINGKILIDCKNRDHLFQEIRPCNITEKGENLMIDRLSFDPIAGTTTNNRIYIKDGKRYDTPFTMYAYNYYDLEQFAKAQDLKISRIFGSWNGEYLDANSRRMLLFMDKKSS
ncbi:MAG: class I SAM-dependent methyltransferase, partial [Bacteroidota bacterium]